jgi:hypothetical protein
MKKHVRRALGLLALALMSLVSSGSALAAPPMVLGNTELTSAARSFDVLSRPAAQELPVAVTRFLASQSKAGAQVEESETRRVAAPGGGMWDVTPGRGVMCLFVEREQTGACTSTADALAGRLSILFVTPRANSGRGSGVPTDTDRFQAGLLPADVVSVAASSRLGRTVKTRVTQDGLYRLAAVRTFGRVQMHRVGGSTSPITKAPRWKSAIGPIARVACPCWNSIPAYHSGPWAFYAGGNYGPHATVTGVSIISDDGNTICGNVINPNNTWAGNFFCTVDHSWGAQHAYNGSMRSGWAGPGAPSASVLGEATEWFNSLA